MGRSKVSGIALFVGPDRRGRDISPAVPFLDGAAVTNPSGQRARDTGLTIAGVGGVLSRSSVLEGRNPMDLPVSHSNEIDRGDSLDLDSSGTRFLAGLDDGRIDEACKSLRRMLGMQIARQAHLPRRRQRQRPVFAGGDAPGRGPRRVVRLRPAQRRVWRRAQAPLFPGCGQLDHRAGQRARRSLPRASRVVRRRLFVGRPAPHGQAVARRSPTWPSRSRRAAGCSSPSIVTRAGCRGLWLGVKQLYNIGVIGRALVLGSVHAVRLAAGVVRDRRAAVRSQALQRECRSRLGRLLGGCRSRSRPRPPCSRSTGSAASVWRTSA